MKIQSSHKHRKSVVKSLSWEKMALGIVSAFMCIVLFSCNGTGNKPAEDTTAIADTVAMQTTAITPQGPKPAWGSSIKPEMQAVMEKLASYKDTPIPQLTAPEARKNHTPADAVMDLMAEHSIPMPPAQVDTMGKDIPSSSGVIHTRIYTPKGAAGPLPVIVYYHGGGFVIATIDTYDASAKSLSEQTGAIVVSVEYRKGPESKFPAAHMDAYTAYAWVVANTASIKGDPKMIAVAGESAGGNLAANVSIMARDKGIMVPVHQLLVYPVAQSDMTTASYQKFAAAKPLDKPMMEWFVTNYLNTKAEAKDPRISLVSANLKGLPATTIINAEIDPLDSDGEMLAGKLEAAGVKVNRKRYDGVTHEFFGMGAIVPEAKDAMGFAAGELKKAFGK